MATRDSKVIPFPAGVRSALRYARAHDQGRTGLPARPILPPAPVVADVAVRVLSHYGRTCK